MSSVRFRHAAPLDPTLAPRGQWHTSFAVIPRGAPLPFTVDPVADRTPVPSAPRRPTRPVAPSQAVLEGTLVALHRLALLAAASVVAATLTTPGSTTPGAAVAGTGSSSVVQRATSGDFTGNGNKVMRAGDSQSQLAGTWGAYQGPADMAWSAYNRAGKTRKAELQWFIDQPRAGWMGAWIPDNQIADKTRKYIELSQNGNPDALVQLTIFRMDPWYTASKTKVPTKKQRASYKRWIRASAAAIGDTPTALMLQPDSTF